MATITRNDLAAHLRDKFGLTSADSYKLINVIFDEISESLIRGDTVKFTDLGTFRILNKPARMGRNPKTGVPAVISARRVVSFRPCTTFRNRVGGK